MAFSRSGIQYSKSSSGISYYDYPKTSSVSEVSQEGVARLGSKVALNVKGYLAGRNGWQFIDTTTVEDGEIRLVLGKTPVIKGLEIGILGSDDILPMKRGDKRRLILPSNLGYMNLEQQPVPYDEDSKRRLYSTVFNSERRTRESEALGDSIVGELILDVELKRVKN